MTCDCYSLSKSHYSRHLCGKLFLRAETQQVDRILVGFSARFWQCNPQPLYHSADVIHAITYSIMLLNTDLHVAEISTRMSRSQFVKNTLGVVLASMNADTDSPLPLSAAAASRLSFDDDDEDAGATLDATTPGSTNAPSPVSRPLPLPLPLRHHPKNRSGSLTSWRSIMQNAAGSQSAIQLGDGPGSASDSPEASRVSLNLLPVGSGSAEYFDVIPPRRPSMEALSGTKKLWEQEIENLLKVCNTPVEGLALFLNRLTAPPLLVCEYRKCMMPSRNNRSFSLLVMVHQHI